MARLATPAPSPPPHSATDLGTKKARIVTMVERVLVVHDDGSRKGFSLKNFALHELLKRSFRKYKAPHLLHREHKSAYDLAIRVARLRCCGSGAGDSTDFTETCTRPMVEFCLAGAMRRHDSKALVVWGHEQERHVQTALFDQYVVRGDRCGCSQAGDNADRLSAELHGINDALGSVQLVPSRRARDNARKRLDVVARHVKVAQSNYGLEAACLPFHAWLRYWDESMELSSLMIEVERVEQVAVIFEGDFFSASEATPTTRDVLIAVGRALYRSPSIPDEAAVSVAQRVIAPPSQAMPEPVKAFGWHQPREAGARALPPRAMVTLRPQAELEGMLQIMSLCYVDACPSVRAHILASAVAGVSFKAVFNRPYVANLDGFSTQAKKSVGTHEFQMVTSVAIRPLTTSNSRSILNVLVICLWPGDDNHENLKTVAEDVELESQMKSACEMPRSDPHAPHRAIIHCNEGWVIDAKAAGNCGGWGQWVGMLAHPSGRDFCTRGTIHGRDVEECTRQTRQDAYASAYFLAARYQRECKDNGDALPDVDAHCLDLLRELAGSVLTKGLLGELVAFIQFFTTRTARLHLALHSAVSSLPAVTKAASNALAIVRAAGGAAVATAKTVLDDVWPKITPFRAGASPKAIPANLGSGEPLKKLAARAEVLHTTLGQVRDVLGTGRAPTTTQMDALEAAATATTSALHVARGATYWQNDKAGIVVKYHSSGDAGAALDARANLNVLSSRLERAGIELKAPPADLGKLQELVNGAGTLATYLDQAMAPEAAETAIQSLFSSAVKELFNRRGDSLVSDAQVTAYFKELGQTHVCFLPGGQTQCAYFQGILHCGRLRFVLGAFVNKVCFGVAHGLKFVHETPPRGKYVPDASSPTLNKGHLEGTQTTQSCLVAKLEERKIDSKQVPNAKGSRMQLRQGDGPVCDRLFGVVTNVDPITGHALMPDPLPVWECYPLLVRDPIHAAAVMLAFLINLLEAEAPSTQFGGEWSCPKLNALAQSVRVALIQTLDALHPQLTSSKGHTIDWLVLSAHLFLNQGVLHDFQRMCHASITTGRMVEDAFETQHHFSKGGIQDHSAPDRHAGHNRLSHALRRITREREAQLRDAKHMKTRDEHTRAAWKTQQPARAYLAASAKVAVDWVTRCKADEGVALDGGKGGATLRVKAHDGSCHAHALYMPGLRKSPVLTLEGQGSADSGGDETDETEDAPEVVGNPEGGTAPRDTTPTTRPTGDGAATTGDADEIEQTAARALNSEDREYTMSEEAAMAAMRADAATLRGAGTTRNVDRAGETAQPQAVAETLLSAVEKAGAASPEKTAQEVLAARSKPLNAKQRTELLKALTGGPIKGVSKLKNADDWATALVRIISAEEQNVPTLTWVAAARERLNQLA